jgi:hypothetical protein
VIEHVRPERHEPVDPVFRLGNPSLAALEDPAPETWTILVRDARREGMRSRTAMEIRPTASASSVVARRIIAVLPYV